MTVQVLVWWRVSLYILSLCVCPDFTRSPGQLQLSIWFLTVSTSVTQKHTGPPRFLLLSSLNNLHAGFAGGQVFKKKDVLFDRCAFFVLFYFLLFFSMKGFNTFPGTKHKSQQEVTGLIPKRKTLNLKFCCGVVTTALRFSCQRKTNI